MLLAFRYLPFDFENARRHRCRRGHDGRRRWYVPNGGEDYPAKMKFLVDPRAAWSSHLVTRAHPLVICGDLNVAHTDRDFAP